MGGQWVSVVTCRMHSVLSADQPVLCCAARGAMLFRMATLLSQGDGPLGQRAAWAAMGRVLTKLIAEFFLLVLSKNCDLLRCALPRKWSVKVLADSPLHTQCKSEVWGCPESTEMPSAGEGPDRRQIKSQSQEHAHLDPPVHGSVSKTDIHRAVEGNPCDRCEVSGFLHVL